jgi:hypothetical protein
MAWSEAQTLAARWEQACDLCQQWHPHWRLGRSYSGFIEALVATNVKLMPAITRRLRILMQQRAGAFWTLHGRCAFGIDGTRIEAAHTADNERGLGCAGRDKTGPQVYLTTLWHLGLRLPWSCQFGPGTASERVHARQLVDDLPARSLLVADAGFCSYDLCHQLLARGHDFLLRVGSNVHLLAELGYYHEERDGIVYLWPEKHRHRPPLVLRLIRLTQGTQQVFLLTNVLDPQELTDEMAADLYHQRWGEEVYHRSFKQTLDRRKLLSRTPQTCLAEAQWIVLGLWLLGLMSLMGKGPAQNDPRQWSVARSRDAVRRTMRNQPPGGRRTPRATLAQILQQAVLDSYQRHTSKTARNYPRKKNEQPPGPPKIQPATPKQIKQATQFPPPNIPKKWTA